ncbi:MAG: type transport system ATP-binding protein [Methylobacteriaceae bacterium]|jgi:ABC-2 type transport system ATP-binding protein|nr:type transport system ATP-binding protein [Methylobacteriaceae bacterium]
MILSEKTCGLPRDADVGVPALGIQDVSHSYRERRALDDVSFDVQQGAFAVLLGLNGAGKTTLFSLITRLYAAQRGSISVLGFDVARDPAQALSRLGVVFQARTLDLDLTVMQNLLYHASLHGIGGREGRELATETLARTEMRERAHDKARVLSGGQMRRIEIARALLHRPSLLLLDEPTVGLDVNARKGIIRYVRELVREENIGVLWTTHLIDEVDRTDDLIILHRGRVLAKGIAGDLVAGAGAANVGAAFEAIISAPTGELET